MLYLRLIILSVGGDVLIDNETLLMTDFVNLKIQSAQSFRDAHKNSVCVYMFIEISTHIYIYILVSTVFLKKPYHHIHLSNQEEPHQNRRAGIEFRPKLSADHRVAERRHVA
jgi:hypothetical protein